MPESTRPLRADAERNRRLLLDAAAAAFAEHGLDVGVAEIARRAGVGQGTVFRRFPTKEHLIAAVVVDRMHQVSARGRELLTAPDPGQAVFVLLGAMVEGAQSDRALFEAVADTFLANEDIRAAHSDLVQVMDRLLRRAQDVGAVRDDVGALDLLMMFKGVCEASRPFNDPGIMARQLELMRAALRPVDGGERLSGLPPTLADMERAVGADGAA
ncbi:MAG TPA: TetR family transcriptional regulator [Solirubrobacteraceae bacterium]|jgi:AcrR family transcriptional regulator|nr:TetR family transcriptional regulator [Solirubrobacteraceae bacterium]